jgi:hypothetical protein
VSFYVYDRPVAGRGAYVGRETLLRSLLDGLHAGRTYLVCGGPRTGRTSTLVQLMALIRERWTRQPKATKTVPVYFDLSGVAGTRALPPKLWEAVAEAVRAPEVHGQAVPPKAVKVDFLRAKEPWEAFEQAARDTWQSASGSQSWARWALLLDAGDLLLDSRFEGLAARLMALLARDEPWTPAAAVIAGGRTLRESLLDPRSPLKPARPLFLGALRSSEAEALARAGLRDIEPDALAALMNATGRHPYLLQRVLAELLLLGPDQVTAAAANAEADMLALFDRIWEELDLGRGVVYRGAYAAPEHALMQLIIDTGTGCTLKVAEKELGIRPLKEYADLLEYCGLVERTMTSDAVVLRPHFESWNAWYSERVLR